MAHSRVSVYSLKYCEWTTAACYIGLTRLSSTDFLIGCLVARGCQEVLADDGAEIGGPAETIFWVLLKTLRLYSDLESL